jgi:hypothetical protein
MPDEFDPYTLIGDPEALGLLRCRVALGLSDPGDAELLSVVNAERARRRRFSVAGSFVCSPGTGRRGDG